MSERTGAARRVFTRHVLKFIFFPLAILVLPNGLSCQERPYWYTLEKGKVFFRNGEYGNALVEFENARRQRGEMYSQMENSLIEFLSVPAVRRRGDSLSRVETLIGEITSGVDAAKALEELYYRYPKESLRDSASAALNKIGELKAYPEAEYWIGEVFRVEGELNVAIGQYKKAYENRALLENPGFDREILFRIADIQSLRREFTDMEQTYLEILKQDELWSANQDTFVKQSMLRILENDGIDRFMTLYRYGNTQTEKAHRLLGFYYFTSGRYTRAADHLLFAFLMQNTVMITEISRHSFGYAFSSMNEFMTSITGYPAITEYARNVEYYRTIYSLGNSLYGDGRLKLARDFWTLLRNRSEAGEWRQRAAAQLERPILEQLRERR